MIFRLKCRTKIENNETERRPNRVKINKHITQKEKNPIFWTKMKFLRQKSPKNNQKIYHFLNFGSSKDIFWKEIWRNFEMKNAAIWQKKDAKMNA